MTDDLRAAYRLLEEAIQDVARLEGFDGMLTDWVVVPAFQRYEGDKAVTQIGRLMPGGDLPYHRMMGLLDYALTLCRAEVCED